MKGKKGTKGGKGSRGRPVKIIRVAKKPPKGKWKVTPGKAHVFGGDTITFHAVGTAATILIPKPDLFEAIGVYAICEGVLTVPVREDGTASIRVKEGAWKRRRRGEPSVECRYAVYCTAGGDFAEGNSSPAIIIDPPSLGEGEPG